MAILLALAASLAWGSSDYLGGQQSRRWSLWSVIVVSQAAGLVGCLVVVAVHGTPAPSLVRLVPAMLAGASGAVSIACFYHALAIGTMSIVAPVSATSAAVPVIVGMVSGERPSIMQLVGMALALGGAVLAAREPRRSEPAREPRRSEATPGRSHTDRHTTARRPSDARLSVLLAVVAALGIGLMLTGLHASARYDPYWALLAARGASAACLLAVVALRRPQLGLRPTQVPLLVLLGVLDTGANGMFAVASTLGYLSIVSVLGSLYPVTTVVLAHAFLGERVTREQGAGIVAALTGIALIAAG